MPERDTIHPLVAYVLTNLCMLFILLLVVDALTGGPFGFFRAVIVMFLISAILLIYSRS